MTDRVRTAKVPRYLAPAEAIEGESECHDGEARDFWGRDRASQAFRSFCAILLPHERQKPRYWHRKPTTSAILASRNPDS